MAAVYGTARLAAKQAAQEAKEADQQAAEQAEAETKRARRLERKRKAPKQGKAGAAIAPELAADLAALTRQAQVREQTEPTAQTADWAGAFLKVFAKTGERAKAAKLVGVSLKTIRQRERDDAEFAEAVGDATAEFVEALQSILIEQGLKKNNALAIFGLLKRFDPDHWHEKLVLDGKVKHTVERPPMPQAELDALLRNMLLASSEETKRQILEGRELPALAEIIEAEPVQPVPAPAPTLDPDTQALAERFGAHA